ncbi:type I-F CRISPR-associated protein Csy1 [Pectinatus frisingensis]|uniref:type I-F CRISPR-associated protein Csy1 n=1 Tax=Pectinatus frisingensis TaxID=865 RepID=UPI0018C62F14|nr:type I-F CRISPR-associated protein Csy1 [Pectinatus frisingensis]
MSIILNYLNKAAESKGKSVEKWLLDTAENAPKCTLATHVGKFTHPDAKIAYFNNVKVSNYYGYVCTDNVDCKVDIVCPAQYIATANFLLLKLEDDNTVIDHLNKNSEKIQQELSALTVNYDEIRHKFLQIDKNEQYNFSDERVKQVYFPVENTYHLLSVLTSSGMLDKLKERIIKMKNYERLAKDKTSKEYKEDYSSVYDITEIGFGGTKPQNISSLNSQSMHGSAYFLSSMPPTLAVNNIRKPKTDFFRNCLNIKSFLPLFYALDKIFKTDKNNINMRNRRKEIYHSIVDMIMNYVYVIRTIEPGWSDNVESLPIVQKIWLDNKYEELRQIDNKWVDEMSLMITRWIIFTYEKILKDKKIVLGDGEFISFKYETSEILVEDKEVLM